MGILTEILIVLEFMTIMHIFHSEKCISTGKSYSKICKHMEFNIYRRSAGKALKDRLLFLNDMLH